jgi:hypothetical protein
MSRPPFDRNATFQIYVNLMAEIKTRNIGAGLVLDDMHRKPPRVPMDPALAGEFCYLQLRKMCEILGVACLLAHGDVEDTRTNNLHDAYHPRKLIKALEKLKPDFFPIPFDLKPGAPLEPSHAETVTEGALTKAELLHLYDNECGMVMHFGAADDLLKGRKTEIHIDRVIEWFKKFARLLVRHRMRLVTGEEVWVDMSLPGHDAEAKLMVTRPTELIFPMQSQTVTTPEGSTLIPASPRPIEF